MNYACTVTDAENEPHNAEFTFEEHELADLISIDGMDRRTAIDHFGWFTIMDFEEQAMTELERGGRTDAMLYMNEVRS